LNGFSQALTTGGFCYIRSCVSQILTAMSEPEKALQICIRYSPREQTANLIEIVLDVLQTARFNVSSKTMEFALFSFV